MSGDWLRETDNMLQYCLTVSGWTGAKLPVFTTTSTAQRTGVLSLSHTHRRSWRRTSNIWFPLSLVLIYHISYLHLLYLCRGDPTTLWWVKAMGAVLYRTDIDTPLSPSPSLWSTTVTHRMNINHHGDPVTVSCHSLYYVINVKRIPRSELEF